MRPAFVQEPDAIEGVLSIKKKLDDRLSDALVFEYTPGAATYDQAGEKHEGWGLLENLRGLQRKAIPGAKQFLSMYACGSGARSVNVFY